jgi:hypothetical protein
LRYATFVFADEPEPEEEEEEELEDDEEEEPEDDEAVASLFFSTDDPPSLPDFSDLLDLSLPLPLEVADEAPELDPLRLSLR